ncbi:Glucose 1-dehydrogenase [Halotydeus destructor]|nr:Glucose 1-dehydrogenase [Halotydeus destructor]
MAANMLSFAGKNIAVTGAGNGFGRAISKKLASLGARLALVDIDAFAVQETREQCSKLSPTNLEHDVILADLRSDTDLVRVSEEMLSKLKSLNVLVNNAGAASLTKLRDDDLMKKFDSLMQLNVRAPLYLTKLLSKSLIETQGCIVNVSSIAAYKASPFMLPYALTKGAVTSMTKNLAIDLGRKGVRVNEVNPGIVATNILKNETLPADKIAAVFQALDKAKPLQRPITPKDIASAVAFLASEEARAINGVSLVIDCGQII